MPHKSNAGFAMPGKRYLLDTNALVALLQGHKGLLGVVAEAHWLGVSVINVLEFLGFDGLTEADRALFLALIARLVVVDLAFGNAALMERVSHLRKTRAIKLPDAIVMASAAIHDATVITNDAVLLKLGASESGYPSLSF